MIAMSVSGSKLPVVIVDLTGRTAAAFKHDASAGRPIDQTSSLAARGPAHPATQRRIALLSTAEADT
jgi:hypothetical protein